MISLAFQEAPRVKGIPVDIWPWLLALSVLLFIVGMFVIGIIVMLHEFNSMGKRLDHFQQNTDKLWKEMDRQSRRVTKLWLLSPLKDLEPDL